MVEVRIFVDADRVDAVSIRRADYWLVEGPPLASRRPKSVRFNPPGGLLVG